ncbi:hypothetical protein [Caproiciproducens sp.]
MKNKKNFWFIFFTVAILSFTLLCLGIKYLLGNPVTPQNIAVYAVLSLVFGAVASALYLLQLKIMCSVFVLGLFAGYLDMFRTFLGSRSGWEDLAGLLSLFTWMAIGLCAGTVLQFLSYFYHKIRYRGKS